MEHPLHSGPTVDKFMAVFGNGSALTAWLFSPSTLTAIGGAVVSLSTAFYFIMRALHERQRMRHEAELHQRDMEAYFQPPIECQDCGAQNPPTSDRCEECGAWIGRRLDAPEHQWPRSVKQRAREGEG